jgi:hypothetical protein
VDKARVETERNVVQEPTFPYASDVDGALLAVEGPEGAYRILRVEAEVEGEMIPGPERDADEGPLGLHSDSCNGSEGPVAAGHADRARAVARERDRIVPF